MSIFKDLSEGTVTGIFSGIGGMAKDLREAFVGKEMTPELQVEIQKKMMDLELATQNAQMSMIVAEANSADPWTSRARPSFLYIIYIILLMLFVGAVLGIWWPNNMDIFFANVGKAFSALPEAMWATFAAGYLGYTGARMSEKKAGVSK